MKVTKQIDRELLRKATLRFLAERFRIAMDVESICRLMAAKRYTDADFDEEDLEQAIAILIGEGLVAREVEQLGATDYYRATGKGIVANERING
jgi:hypothetical protein